MATETSHTRGHDTVLDVTAEQLAKVYAQAFLSAAGQAGSGADAIAELRSVVEEILDRFPDFAEAIQSAFLSHEDRIGIIDRVLGGRVDAVVLNTLKVMSQHGRLGLLRSVAKQSQELFNRAGGMANVSVTSATPLTDQLRTQLETTLREKLSIEPIIEASVDPDMIAGMKIRVGDTVYDGSIRTVFDKARAAMVDRAIARIEQSPDHFLTDNNSEE